MSEMSASDVEEDLEPFRSSVDAAVQKYIADTYTLGKGICTVYATRKGGQACLTICISSLHAKLKSFWAGRFTSEFKIVFDPTSASIDAQLVGKVWIHTHYFEDGNVQMTSSRDSNPAVKCELANLASAVVAAVKAEEDIFQNGLNDHFYQLARSFKSLRRAMPVSRQPMDWSSARGSLLKEMRS